MSPLGPRLSPVLTRARLAPWVYRSAPWWGEDSVRGVLRLLRYVWVLPNTSIGPFFLPACVASSAWCLCRRVDPYRQSVFEREAYRTEAEWRDGFG